MTDKQDQTSRTGAAAEKDAEGQFVQSKHGAHNNGVTSATPRVTTGTDDATFKGEARKRGDDDG
jgi:hypothetical protein